MIARIAAAFALIALFAGAAAAQQGATAPIPPPPDTAASSLSQINPTAGPPANQPAEAAVKQPMKAARVSLAARRAAREHRETQALNWLEATGNRDFSDVRRDGRDYRATVTQNGAPQTVIVNPDTGKITPVD